MMTADADHYVVGKMHRVTVVRARYLEYKARWWPVLGPMHEDAKGLNFPYQHWHLDFRFAPRFVEPNMVMVAPILASHVEPEGGTEAAIDKHVAMCRETKLARDAAEKDVRGFLAGFPASSWKRTAWRKCQRTMRTSNVDMKRKFDCEVMQKLAQRITARIPESKTWRIDPENPVCPHKGTCLRGVNPRSMIDSFEDDIAAGIIEPTSYRNVHREYIECPLHGLRWCTETGELL